MEVSSIGPVKFKPVLFTQEDIGWYLFESATEGLYVNPLHIIREYVANEVDSRPPPTKIKVWIEGENISIWGDGAGMNEKELDEARKMGYSWKDPAKFVGFRGIGIWSGVSVADTILISTTKKDATKKYILKIDGKGIREDLSKREAQSLVELLQKHTEIGEDGAPSEEHGTHVELMDIRKEVRDDFLLEKVRKYMGEVLPVDFTPTFNESCHGVKISGELRDNVPDYRTPLDISLNGEPVYRPPYIEELEPPVIVPIWNNGKQIGFCWACLHHVSKIIDQEESRGFVFRRKNFSVGERGLCHNLISHPSQRSLLNWWVGEIHVIDPNILPDAQRTNFESGEAKKVLEEVLRKELRKLIKKARQKSTKRTVTEALQKASEIKSSVSFKDEKEKGDLLSEIDRTRRKLKRAKTKEAEGLPQSITDEAESAMSSLDQLTVRLLAEKRIGPPERVIHKVPTIDEIIKELNKPLKLTQEAKLVLETVEAVLNECLAMDPVACEMIKRRIIKKFAGQ